MDTVACIFSFVRSVTMDKWKDSELAKMKVCVLTVISCHASFQAGGNRKAREFLESQPDFKLNWTLQQKYNSKAAALLRDKVRP